MEEIKMFYLILVSVFIFQCSGTSSTTTQVSTETSTTSSASSLSNTTVTDATTTTTTATNTTIAAVDQSSNVTTTVNVQAETNTTTSDPGVTDTTTTQPTTTNAQSVTSTTSSDSEASNTTTQPTTTNAQSATSTASSDSEASNTTTQLTTTSGQSATSTTSSDSEASNTTTQPTTTNAQSATSTISSDSEASNTTTTQPTSTNAQSATSTTSSDSEVSNTTTTQPTTTNAQSATSTTSSDSEASNTTTRPTTTNAQSATSTTSSDSEASNTATTQSTTTNAQSATSTTSSDSEVSNTTTTQPTTTNAQSATSTTSSDSEASNTTTRPTTTNAQSATSTTSSDSEASNTATTQSTTTNAQSATSTTSSDSEVSNTTTTQPTTTNAQSATSTASSDSEASNTTTTQPTTTSGQSATSTTSSDSEASNTATTQSTTTNAQSATSTTSSDSEVSNTTTTQPTTTNAQSATSTASSDSEASNTTTTQPTTTNAQSATSTISSDSEASNTTTTQPTTTSGQSTTSTTPSDSEVSNTTTTQPTTTNAQSATSTTSSDSEVSNTTTTQPTTTNAQSATSTTSSDSEVSNTTITPATTTNAQSATSTTSSDSEASNTTTIQPTTTKAQFTTTTTLSDSEVSNTTTSQPTTTNAQSSTNDTTSDSITTTTTQPTTTKAQFTTTTTSLDSEASNTTTSQPTTTNAQSATNDTATDSITIDMTTLPTTTKIQSSASTSSDTDASNTTTALPITMAQSTTSTTSSDSDTSVTTTAHPTTAVLTDTVTTALPRSTVDVVSTTAAAASATSTTEGKTTTSGIERKTTFNTGSTTDTATVTMTAEYVSRITTDYVATKTGNLTTTIQTTTTSPAEGKGCDKVELSKCFSTISDVVTSATYALASRSRVLRDTCKNLTDVTECGEKLGECSDYLTSYVYLFRSVLITLCSEVPDDENEDSRSDERDDKDSDERSDSDESDEKNSDDQKKLPKDDDGKPEGKYCNIQAAGHCLSEFLDRLPYNSVSTVCRLVTLSVKCMKSAVQGCPSHQRNIFHLLVTRVTMTQNRLCGSRSCQLDMATGCMKEADTAVEHLQKNPDMAIFLCSKLKSSLVCVYNHTAECDIREDNSNVTDMMMKLRSHHSIMVRMCNEQNRDHDYEDWWEVSDELAFGLFIDSPYAPRKAVCRSVDAAVARQNMDRKWSEDKTEEMREGNSHKDDEKSDKETGLSNLKQYLKLKARKKSEVGENKSGSESSRSGESNGSSSEEDKDSNVDGKEKRLRRLSARNMLHHIVGDYCDEENMDSKEDNCTDRRDTMTTTVAPCNYQAALNCVSDFNIPGRFVSVLFGESAVELCKNVYDMLVCVHKNVYTCDMMQKKMVSESVNSVLRFVGNHCTRPTFSTPSVAPCVVRNTKCQSHDIAEVCLDKYEEEGDSSETCRAYNSTAECVQGRTEHCYSLQSVVPVYLLQRLGDEIMCSTDLETLPRDDHTQLARCSLQLTENVHEALVSHNLIKNLVCVALKAFHVCFEDLELPAVTRLYIRKFELLLGDFYQENCVIEEDRSMPASNSTMNITTTTTPVPPKEPRSCNKGEAAKCVSQHLIKLLGRPFLALPRHTHICSEMFAVKRCVEQHTGTCSAEYKKSLTGSLGLWTSVYEKVCLSQRTALPEEKRCDPDLALLCLQYFGESVSMATMQNLEHTCSELDHTLSCVHMTVDTCDGDQLGAVNASLAVVQNIIGDSCPEVSDALYCTEQNTDVTMDRNTTGNSTSGRKTQTFCKTLPVCNLNWDHCMPSSNPSDICGNKTVAKCITDSIRDCDNSVLLHGHYKLQSTIARLALENSGSCDLSVTFPDSFNSDDAVDNCTKEFYTSLEKNYILTKEADNRVLCGIFTTLFTCMEQESAMSAVVMQRIMGNVGRYISDETQIICKPELTTPAPTVSPTQECGEVPVDLVFLLDESGSVGSSNFGLQLDFVKALINSPRLTASIESGALRIGIVTFASNPFTIFNLNKYNSVTDILSAVGNIRYNRGGTRIGRALDFVKTNSFIAESGTRKEAPKILILMTDGKSSDNVTSSAVALRENDVTILVISVGKNVDYQQLYEIASDAQKNVYEVDNFQKLHNFTSTFLDVIPCPEDRLTCDAIGGIQCYKKQSLGMFAGMLPLSQRSSVCSMTEEYTECISNLTSTCSKTKLTKFNTLSELTQKTIDNQKICTKPVVVEGNCSTEKAMSCIGFLTSSIAMYHNTPVRSAVCLRIPSTESCVLENIVGCPKHVKAAIIGTYTEIQTIARQSCMGKKPKVPAPDDCDHLQSDGTNMCDTTEALNCLVSVRSAAMTHGKEQISICSYVPVTKRCVMKHISGCEKYERDTMRVMFSSLMRKVALKCPEVHCDTCGALQCVKDQKSLLDKNHPYLCMRMEGTKACVAEKVKHCKQSDVDFVNRKMNEVLEKTQQKCKMTAEHCLSSFEKTSWEILRYKPGLMKQISVEDDYKFKDTKDDTGDTTSTSTDSSDKGRSKRDAGSTESKESNENHDKSSSEEKSESKESGSSGKMSEEFRDFVGGWDQSDEELYDENKLICEEELDQDTKDLLAVYRKNLDLVKTYEKDKGHGHSDKSNKKSEGSTGKSGENSGKSTEASTKKPEDKSDKSENKQVTNSTSVESAGSNSTHSSQSEESTESDGRNSSQSKESTESDERDNRQCRTRLGWKCEKARIFMECIQSSLQYLPHTRQAVLRSSIMAVWGSVKHKCTVNVQCFTCDKALTNQECNANAVTSCPANQQGCQTIFDSESGHVTKSCVNPNICKTQCTNSKRKCSVCCYGNLCNQPLTTVIEEPDSCKGDSAVKCAFSVVSATMSLKQGYCSVIRKNLECIATHTKTCVGLQYRGMAMHVYTMKNSALVTGCRLQQLHCNCGLCGTMSLGITIQNPFRNSTEVCRHLKHTVYGSSIATVENHCTESDFKANLMSLILARSVIGHICLPSEDDHSMITRLTTNVMTTTSVPAVTSTSVAGDSDKTDESCNEKEIKKCVSESLIQKEIMLSTLYGNFSKVCSTVMEMKKCLAGKLETCSDDVVSRVNTTLSEKLGWVEGYCHPTDDELEYTECNLPAAKQCIKSLLESSNTTTKLCMNLNDTASCLQNHTKMCLSIQKVPVFYLLGHLKDTLQGVCNLTYQSGQPDMYHNLSQCILGFTNTVHHSLINVGVDSDMMICNGVMKLQGCLYEEHLPPLAKLYLQNILYVSYDLMKVSCPAYHEYEEKPLYCYRCHSEPSDKCHGHGKVSVCDRKSEACGSMAVYSDSSDLVYYKGCAPKTLCNRTESCDGQVNCSYCCDSDFCNVGGQTYATNPTVEPQTPTQQPAACSYSVADIAILLDSSSSIGSSDYAIMLNFVKSLVSQMNIGPDAIHLSLAVFSSEARIEFKFNSYDNKTKMLQFIDGMEYVKQTGTDLATGLELVRTQIFTEANGDRPKVADIVLLMTDGKFSETESEVQRFREADITILAVGVGSSVRHSQLLGVASKPEYVFTVGTFSVLDTIKTRLLQTIPCPEAPDTCMLEKASVCVNSHLSSLMIMPFIPLSQRPAICSGISAMDSCTNTSLANCPAFKVQQLQKLSAWILNKASYMCKFGSPTLESEDKEEEDSEGNSRLTCEQMLKKCLSPIHTHLAFKIDNTTETCSVLNSSLYCLKEKMANCSFDDGAKSYQLITGIVGNICPRETTMLCNMTNVTDCTSSVKSCSLSGVMQYMQSYKKAAEDDDDGIACFESGTDLQNEMSDSIQGCSSLQFNQAEYSFYSYLDTLQCHISGIKDPPQDIFSNMTECTRNFTSDLTSAITSPVKDVYGLCPVTKHLTVCLKDYVQSIPLSLRDYFTFTLNATFEVLADFEKDNCSVKGPNVTVTESGDCQLNRAIVCANSLFQQSAFIGFQRIADRTAFCREQQFLQTCARESIARCSSVKSSQIMTVVELSMAMMNRSNACRNGDSLPKSEVEEDDSSEEVEKDKESLCSPEKAWQCISQLGLNISYYGTSQSNQELCSLANHTQSCVTHHLENCTEKTTMSLKWTLMNVYRNALRMCHRKKDDVETAPPKCVDPHFKYPRAVCNPFMAIKCALQLQHETFNPFTTRDRVCVVYAKSLQCFYHFANPCDGYVRSGLHTVMMHSRSLVDTSHCDVEVKSPCVDPPTPSNCTLHKAVVCVQHLKAVLWKHRSQQKPGTVMKKEDISKICGLVTEVRKCIQSNRVDCPANEVYHVTETFYSLQQLLGNQCDHDNERDVRACIDDFNMKSSRILKYVWHTKSEDTKDDASKEKKNGSNESGDNEGKDGTSADKSNGTSSGESEGGKDRRRRSAENQSHEDRSDSRRDEAQKSQSAESDSHRSNTGGKESTNDGTKVPGHKDHDYYHRYGISSMCGEIEAAWKCIQGGLAQLSYHRRTILNMTLQATYRAIQYRCKPQTCYSCYGLDDNVLCNKQRTQTCNPGEVCYSTVKDRIMKGCLPQKSCNTTCSGDKCYCCQGHLCNREATIPKPMKCNMTKAIVCSIQVISMVTRSSTITEILLSKSLTCMETYSSDCSSEYLTNLRVTAVEIRRLLAVSSCAGEAVTYQHCGSVAVLSLGKIATSPSAMKSTVCRMMNSTKEILTKIDKSGICFTEEMMHVKNSLGYINSKFIGDKCTEQEGETTVKCKAHSVLQSCLGLTHKTQSGDSRLNQTCKEMNVNDTLQCIVDHTGSCTTTELASVEQEIKMFVSRAVKMCNLTVEQILQPFSKHFKHSDSYDELSVCVSMFGHNLMDVLSKGSGKVKLCKVYMTTASCIRKADLPSVVKSLSRGMLNLIGNNHDSICGHQDISAERFKQNSASSESGSKSGDSDTSDSNDRSRRSAESDSEDHSSEDRSSEKNDTSSETSKNCDLHLTSILLIHHTMRIYTSPLFSSADIRYTCSVYTAMEDYVKRQASVCNNTAYQETYSTALQFFHHAAVGVCAAVVSEDDESPGEEEKCPASAVEKCFSKLVPHLMSRASPQKQFCLEIQSAVECVLSFDCDKEEIGHISEALSVVGHIGGQRCPELQKFKELDYDLTNMCSLHGAFTCLHQLLPSNTSCSNLADVHNCILGNLTGCSEVKRSGFTQLLGAMEKKKVPKCSGVSLTLLPHAQSKPTEKMLKQCLEKFQTDSSTKMSSDQELANHWTCDKFETLTECVGNVTKLKDGFIVNQLLKNLIPTLAELIKICRQESVGFLHPSSCPVVDQDQVGTCMVECVMDKDCPWNKRCCSNGCGYTCVAAVQNDDEVTTSDEGTCDLPAAMSCVSSAMSAGVVVPFYNHDDKNAVCQEKGIVSTLHFCIHNTSQGCPAYKRQHVKMMSYLAGAVLINSGVCWDSFLTCDASTALECIAHLGTEISYSSSPVVKSNSTDVCSTYQLSRHCVVQNMYGCTDVVRNSASRTFQETQCLMGGTCSIIGEPQVAEAPPKCVDEGVVTAESECFLHGAVSCFSNVRVLRANPFTTLDNVCLAYGKSLQCYVNNMHKCDKSLKLMTKIMVKKFSDLNDKCKTELKSTCTPVEDKCNLQGLEGCIEMVKNVVTASIEDGEVCLMITKAWTCIKQRSGHCSPSQIQSVQHKLTNILENFEIDCGDSLDVCYYRMRDNALNILTRRTTGEITASDETSDSGSKSKEKSSSKDSADKSDSNVEDSSEAKDSRKRAAENSRETTTKKPASKEKSKECDKSKKSKECEETTTTPRTKNTTASTKAPPPEDEDWDKDEACQAVEDAWTCVKAKLAISKLQTAVIQSVESSLEMVNRLVWEECQGLACYTCRNSGSNKDCNANGKAYCSANKQACKTEVKNGKISKDCIEPDTCVKSCGAGKSCQCCYGYMCNEPGVDVYYDPPTCSVSVIGKRVLKFVTQIVESLEKPHALTCSMIDLVLEELANDTLTCSKRLSEFISALRTSLAIVRESICRVPITCNVEKATTCITQLNDTVQNNATHACSAYDVTMTCLSEVYVTCNEQEKLGIQKQLQAVFGDINCRKMPPFSFNATTNVISLVEGKASKYIHLRMLESPKKKCKGSNCQVVVTITVEHKTEVNTRICPDGTVIPQLTLGDSVTAGFCSHTFTTDNWDQNISIPLTAVMDNLYDGTQELKLEINADMYEDGKSVLERLLASYTVLVLDNDKRRVMCTSINDPHMTTFDKLYYNNFYRGEFILYKNSPHSQEVRAVFKGCRKASCNCAVIVKVEDDYFILDMCNPKTRVPAINMYKTNNLTAGFRVFSMPSGPRKAAYKVLLKTGTEVLIMVNKRTGLINILISPSAADVEQVEGLCGNFDGDHTNDLVLPDGQLYEVNAKYLVVNRRNSRDTLAPRGFNTAWRVKVENMWYLNNFDRTVHSAVNVVYCSCPLSAKGTTNACQPLLPATRCPVQKGIDLMDKSKTFVKNGLPTGNRVSIQGRRKRQTSSQDSLSSLGIELNAEPQEATFPVGNWTEEKAREFCEDYIKNSALGQSCGQVTAIDEGEITGCIEDIKLSGDTSFADSAKDSMQSKCESEMDKDTKYTTDPNARKVAETVLSQTCDNNCNSNGVCANGTCRCFQNFMGPSCSMGLNDPPITHRLGEDFCDFRTDPECDSVSVYGEQFVDLSTLTCHYKNIQWTGNKWEETGQAFTSNAAFISYNLVECNLPAGVATKTPLRGATLSVSNNGNDQSVGDFRFIAHDSLCYLCTAVGCQSTQNGCVINNICYGKGDVSSENPCHFCDPVTSTTVWTVKLASYCPTTERPTTTSTTTTSQQTTATDPTTTETMTTETSTQPTSAAGEDSAMTAVAVASSVAGVALLALVVLGIVFMTYKSRMNSKHKKTRGYETRSSNSIEDPRMAYDNSAYHHPYQSDYYRGWYATDPRDVFAYQIPKRHKQHAKLDPTNHHKDSSG